MLFPLQRRLQLAGEEGPPGDDLADGLPTDELDGGDPWDAEKNGGRRPAVEAAGGSAGGGEADV